MFHLKISQHFFKPVLMLNLQVVRTPADADEHPLAELVGGVRQNDGGVKVAAFSKHPEEICGVEIVERRSDKATPNLQNEKHPTTF